MFSIYWVLSHVCLVASRFGVASVSLGIDADAGAVVWRADEFDAGGLQCEADNFDVGGRALRSAISGLHSLYGAYANFGFAR